MELEVAWENFCINVGRLIIALWCDACKLAFLPVRFFLWLGGE